MALQIVIRIFLPLLAARLAIFASTVSSSAVQIREWRKETNTIGKTAQRSRHGLLKDVQEDMDYIVRADFINEIFTSHHSFVILDQKALLEKEISQTPISPTFKMTFDISRELRLINVRPICTIRTCILRVSIKSNKRLTYIQLLDELFRILREPRWRGSTFEDVLNFNDIEFTSKTQYKWIVFIPIRLPGISAALNFEENTRATQKLTGIFVESVLGKPVKGIVLSTKTNSSVVVYDEQKYESPPYISTFPHALHCMPIIKME